MSSAKVLGIVLVVVLGWASTGYGATFTVTSSEDAGPGTLRQAILDANSTTGTTDTITFAVSNSITVFTTLHVTAPVVIEGGGVTLGAAVRTNVLALQSGSDGSLVRGLAVVDGWWGLYVNSKSNTIMACRFGTDWVNSMNRGNEWGVLVSGDHNIIGSSLPMNGNVFSGNSRTGLGIIGRYNWAKGNLVGLNSEGTAALSNGFFGIELGTEHNLIGGSGPGEGNVVSGNGIHGVYVGSIADRIVGNICGYNYVGDALIPNGSDADILCSGINNYFGNNHLGQRMRFTGARGNTVVGNVVGMFPNGSGSSNSAKNGIFLGESSFDNFIGLPDGNGNLFAYSENAGVQIDMPGRNSVRGNTVVGSGGLPVLLTNNANGDQQPPVVIWAAAGTAASGTADPGEDVELFLAEGPGDHDGTVRYLGAATADGNGVWQITSLPIPVGVYVCAIATDAQNNSSQLSNKVLVQDHPPTIPTPTSTPTPSSPPNPNPRHDVV